MKKLIITGAAGFIGYHCLEILKNKNYEVFAISRRERISSGNIKWIKANLFNFEETKSLIKEINADLILHLSWITTPGIFYESEENHMWVNSSLNLLKAFLENGGKRVVVAGSCAEYDWNKKEMLEDVGSNPSSLYGNSKLLLYNEVKNLSLNNQANLAWGRIFNVFGPKEPSEKLVSFLIRAALLKNKIQCIAKDDIRDFIYVKEVANIFIFLLENTFDGIINIATGTGLSVNQIVKLIEKKLNVSNICDFKQNVSKFPYVVGNTKNLQTLNYRYLFDLEQSIEETIKWWRDEINC